MKTYYDLTSSELAKYRKEFKKTPQGKNLFYRIVALDVVFLVLLALYFLIVFYGSETAISGFNNWFFFIVLVVGYDIENIYYNINFNAWLKNKHDIKRW